MIFGQVSNYNAHIRNWEQDQQQQAIPIYAVMS